MSEQVRKSRKRPDRLEEGDDVRILSTPTQPTDRMATILLKDSDWCLCRIENEIVWLQLKQV